MLNILYEDSQLMVTVKPAGVESQSSSGFGQDMVSLIRNELMKRERQKTEKICTELSTNWGKLSTKPVEKSLLAQTPYVGVIHRLDKPVSGVMVYAKTKNAAAALSSQLQKHQMKKVYEAVVCGKPVNSVENLVDYLKKSVDGNDSQVVDKGITGAKRAELTLEALRFLEEGPNGGPLTLLRIQLETGRHHQIRVQLAAHGMPVYGDARYGRGEKGPLALCAVSLSFLHPRTKKRMEFHMEPSDGAFAWMKER